MIATHADSVVAEAINKGFHGFDYQLAYDAAYKDAMTPPEGDTTRDWHDRQPGVPYEARPGLTYYKQLGYVPVDKTAEAASETLEDAYDDFAVAQVAKALGRDKDFRLLSVARATTVISTTRRAGSCRDETPTAPGRARTMAGPRAISGSTRIPCSTILRG